MFSRVFKATVFLCACAWAGFSWAANLDTASISDIVVQGNASVPANEIRSWLKVRTGDKVSDVKLLLDRDLIEIYGTGKFKDVQFWLQPLVDGSVQVVIRVQEKPVIQKLSVKGNQALSEKELLEKADLKPGAPYDDFAAARAADKMAAYYKEKEYFQAVVTPAAEIKGNAVSLDFTVNEGLKVKVTKIIIQGKQAFSADKIKGLMDTKEAGWFVGGTYKEETFRDDLKKILAGYAREGYLKAKLEGYSLQDIEVHLPEIVKAAVSVDVKTREMTITLTVEEGVQYKLGKLEINGSIIYSEEELLRRTELRTGTIFNRLTFEQDLQQVRMAYAEKGYIYCEVTPELNYRDDASLVDVTVNIRENTIARVEKIDIRGNTTTKDKVIRRELTVNPGDPFDTRQVQHSREKVMNLGFFQDVKIDTEPGSTPGEQVLVFEVEERQTGTISLGAGYSSVDYLMGYLQLTQANLFGNGQSVSLQWELGSLRQSWQMSFTEPYLFDSPVSFGVDVWDINKNRGYSGQLYNLLSQGGDIRLGRRFDESWNGYLTYKLESDEYSDIESGLQGTYPAGRNDTSSISPALVYDTRDNIFDATTGVNQRLSTEIAGGPLGGDNNFVMALFDSSYYVPLVWKLVLALHGGVAYSDGYQYGVNGFTDVPPAKLFRAGGTDSVRGYGEGALVPRDKATGQVLAGGRARMITNVELHFPIIGPLKGVAFFDSGNTWERWGDFKAYPSLYKGTGVGVRLTIPGTVILIRFDFGYPLDPDPDGKAQTLNYHFNIGNIF